MQNIIGIMASGRGSNFQSIIDHINKGALDAKISVLITDNKNANAINIANENNIPVKIFNRETYPSKKEFEKDIVKTLLEFNVELVVLAGYMRIVGEILLNAFPMRIINIHPALLPSFPGLNAQKQALEYGVRFTGCTVHFVTADVDAGPIILQSVVPVEMNDTEKKLSERILDEEHKILPKAMDLFFKNKLEVIGRTVRIKSS